MTQSCRAVYPAEDGAVSLSPASAEGLHDYVQLHAPRCRTMVVQGSFSLARLRQTLSQASGVMRLCLLDVTEQDEVDEVSTALAEASARPTCFEVHNCVAAPVVPNRVEALVLAPSVFDENTYSNATGFMNLSKALSSVAHLPAVQHLCVQLDTDWEFTRLCRGKLIRQFPHLRSLAVTLPAGATHELGALAELYGRGCTIELTLPLVPAEEAADESPELDLACLACLACLWTGSTCA